MFRSYVRLFHDNFYYKKVYYIDMQNIPDNVPVMLVSNHQNGLSDALGFAVSVRHPRRRLRMIARADAFTPLFAPALRWMGILPAYRSLYNGTGSTVRNRSTLEQAEEELMEDGIVGIYPEAGHQDKHWLGKFSVGYLHIVFEAARRTHFEKEIFLVPSCNHYSDYLSMDEQMLVWYGEPISAKPYYEAYRKDPIEARMQLNGVIREKVAAMMLNITDLDNYDAIDYLRLTYGVEYAHKRGYDPEDLPQKLMADKELFARLDGMKKENQDFMQQIYDDTIRLKTDTEGLGIHDRDLNRDPGWAGMILRAVGLALLAPLFVVACIPNILIYYIPRRITSRVKDEMLHSGIHFGAAVLFLMPVLYLITFALMWTFFSFAIALVHVFCLPFLGVFAWRYSRSYLRWISAVRYLRLRRKKSLQPLIALRKNIYDRLNHVLSQE
ncbi:MAG: 1-acyl-sn-glycerol-3-phosphate acyltransferase [Bacteroides sp.]|nr:1-acyl-sn-glycerol-3-phosphate acyltransferase [Bacteroides sp.]